MAGLVRIEAARLARHPGTVLPLLLLGPVLYAITDARTARFPILQDADQLSQPAVALLLGGAALIQSNLAVLRSHRHGTAAALDVLVLPTRWRTAAHLLALLPLGALAALIVACHIAYLATRPGAVGAVNPYELATGPALVLLLGATGVLLGRLVRSLIVGPLLTVAIAAIMLTTVALVAPGSHEPDYRPAGPPSPGRGRGLARRDRGHRPDPLLPAPEARPDPPTRQDRPSRSRDASRGSAGVTTLTL